MYCTPYSVEDWITDSPREITENNNNKKVEQDIGREVVSLACLIEAMVYHYSGYGLFDIQIHSITVLLSTGFSAKRSTVQSNYCG